ncbi:MAG: regulatory protein RecX [Kineosporiaceae bacterium]
MAVARAIALRQLTAAPKTRAQLGENLARRGVPEGVAESLLDRFEQVGLLDDAEYARMWVESRHAGRGLSRRALEHELRARGIAHDLVRDAVGVVDREAEFTAACDLLRRRLPSMQGDDPARRQRRLLGMLARKGYGSELAIRAWKTVHAEAEADAETEVETDVDVDVETEVDA